MNRQADKFFNDIKGKRVAFCGIGTSNLPLIKMFADRGAIVTACDKRTEEQLGENAQLARECGAQLSLGENYLVILRGYARLLLSHKIFDFAGTLS